MLVMFADLLGRPMLAGQPAFGAQFEDGRRQGRLWVILGGLLSLAKPSRVFRGAAWPLLTRANKQFHSSAAKAGRFIFAPTFALKHSRPNERILSQTELRRTAHKQANRFKR